MKTSKTALTIDAYNKNAESYTSKFSEFDIYNKKIIEFQKKYLPPKARVLDLGCGPGHNIQILQKKDPTCTCIGIDLAGEFINIARQKNPSATLIEDDLRNFRADETIDVVIASFCIVHLSHDETRKLLQEVSKSLSQNGHLYLSFMKGNTSGFESTSFSKEAIFFNYYSEKEIVEMLKDVSIISNEVTTEDYQESDGSTTTDIFIFATKVDKKKTS